MRRFVPKLALTLQAACPVLVMFCGTIIVFTSRSDAAKQPGPPYYLPFALFCLLLSAVLAGVALTVWISRPLGWCLCILLDCILASVATYEAASTFLAKAGAPLLFYLTSFGVAGWFGFLVILLLPKESRSFFRLPHPIGPIDTNV
jgi:asparagine N-glycosylation enzyme membrane subunit Stt3